jgi:hypothetical protein
MSQKLFESDFLTTDIQSFFKNSSNLTGGNAAAAGAVDSGRQTAQAASAAVFKSMSTNIDDIIADAKKTLGDESAASADSNHSESAAVFNAMSIDIDELIADAKKMIGDGPAYEDEATADEEDAAENSDETSDDTEDSENASSEESEDESSNEADTGDEVKDWGAELKKRLDANKKLSKDAQRKESEIEDQFFMEFFKANWDLPTAKHLMSFGEELKTLLKVIGFNETNNPILAFLKLGYVKRELLATKLINSVTFKAIYNAFVKNQIAHTEYTRENGYNIIYCRELYKRPVKEIADYIETQSTGVLKFNSEAYSEVQQLHNRKAFFYIDDIEELNATLRKKEIAKVTDASKIPDARDSGTTLNALKLAQAVLNSVPGARGTERVAMSAEAQERLINELNTVEKILAAIVHIDRTTNIGAAEKALNSSRFNSIQFTELKKALDDIEDILPKKMLITKDAETLVAALLDKLEKL